MTETFFGRHCDFFYLLLDKTNCIKPVIILESKGPCVCSCNHHGECGDYLHMYPPLGKYNCLTAHQADQLRYCVMNSCVTHGLRSSVFNNTHAMVLQVGGFGGLDTFNTTTHSDRITTLKMLAIHKAMSIHGQQDLVHFLSLKRMTGKVLTELENKLLDYSRESINLLGRYTTSCMELHLYQYWKILQCTFSTIQT